MSEDKAGNHDVCEEYRHADPVVDQALEWFARLNAGETVDPETRLAFEGWLSAGPDHRMVWEQVADVWAAPETLLASQQVAAQAQADNVVRLDAHERRPAPGRPRFGVYAMVAAAALVLAIATPQVLPSLLLRWQADYRTDAGKTQELVLPDGSQMVLNGQSAVALDFADGRRGVRVLAGEAWFDVVHDERHPFHVAGKFSDVQVRGTAFAVRVDGDGDTIVLERGRVDAIHDRGDIAPVHLSAGEMVRASDAAMSAVAPFDSEEMLGWLEGRIVFSARPLGEALDAIKPYLNGTVVVLNRDLLDVAVSGHYRTDSAGTAIASIVSAAGGKITRLPGGIIIIR
ncbi:FecR domain-containing protein [Rhizobiaceae bacterium BDR2-2]|uniref:FecR domain-containing protein n=1 Tax=Ectorhizobium quercum TaxID=2965071 RepID=A0AAE3SWZ0_9HYPH|nr:FecR domain-containing protein [Ectorhizobium quercum]MCX8997915.1 FecR domain-containing protein [Ectorhizobium quercum]